MSPTISVIVPIYNAGKYIERCLTSIAEQTYEALQVILVDDGSTDDSATIAQAFADKDTRFALIRQANSGQAIARNNALEQATGYYISFVDADDYLAPDFYEHLTRQIGEADVLQFGYTKVDNNGQPLAERYPKGQYEFTTPWSRLYRKTFIDTHNLSFPAKHIYEDVIFSLDLWIAHPTIQMSQEKGYYYRANPESTTAIKHDTTPLFRLMKKRYGEQRLSVRDRIIVSYTKLRLHLHFLLER